MVKKKKLKRKPKPQKIKIRFIVFIIVMIILLALAIFFFLYSLLPEKPRNNNPEWGVTFSPRFAQELHLDWQNTFINMLDELKLTDVRISAYWDEIEPENNQYNFEQLDWMINEVEKRDGKVVLAVGRKLLRWPECYEPDWVQDLMYDTKEKELLEMIETVVNRYKDKKVINMWQVENEALFPFGRCPKPNKEIFVNEIDLVHSLDPDRQIMLTDSGELSTWLNVTKYADILGITMYRDVSNPLLGDFHWASPPAWYSKRAYLAEKRVDKVIVAEFQMEPWFNVPFTSVPIIEQYEKFSPELFIENTEYAKEAGFEKYYIWGVEWWYYMKKHGYSDYIDLAKEFINK